MKKLSNFLLLNNKAFSLLESLLSLLLISLFLLLILNIFNNFFNLENDIIIEAENKQDLFYILECLDQELVRSSKIYRAEEFYDFSSKHPDNIGIVFMKYNPNPSYSEFKYNYSSYYIHKKIMRRAAYNTNNNELPINRKFTGHNLFMRDVLKLKSNLSNNKDYLILKLEVGSEEKSYERKKYIFLKNKEDIYE